jgi:hypothetical protein
MCFASDKPTTSSFEPENFWSGGTQLHDTEGQTIVF